MRWCSAVALSKLSRMTKEMKGRIPISRAACRALVAYQYWSLKVVVPLLIISRQATLVPQ